MACLTRRSLGTKFHSSNISSNSRKLRLLWPSKNIVKERGEWYIEQSSVVARRRFELLSWGPKPLPYPMKDIESKFVEHCLIDERLQPSVVYGYRYVVRRFLRSCKGEISKDSVRKYLSLYLSKAPKTYNNQLDGLRAFIGRFLGNPEVMNGFKKAHQNSVYEFSLPTIEQLRLGFKGLRDDRARSIYLMFLSSGLRKGELLNLTKSEIDFATRTIRSKHDTRTKKAGVTFYSAEASEYLTRYLGSRKGTGKRVPTRQG